jgi:AsmA family protein
MDGAATTPPRHGHPLWIKLLAGIAIVAVLLALLVVFFPWDSLRGPLNRYVSEKTGHHFEITRKLDVKVGRNTRILADGIEVANPDWAQDPQLLTAQSAEIQIELLPLLQRRIVLPLVKLHQPQLALQVEADGRRSWALGRDTADRRNVPQIGALVVDQGTLHYVASHRGADIHTDFSIDASASDKLPLSFKSKGTWEKDPFTAQGRTGNVLYLSERLQHPFPMEVQATAGSTVLHAAGDIASLATLDGAVASINLQGHDLGDLYKLVGVVLPATPRYSLRAVISKHGDIWQVRQIEGKLGDSDLTGELSFDRERKVPLLTGKVASRSLDFDDLAPLVGLPEQPRSAAALPQVRGPRRAPVQAAPRDPTRKVLPTASLDVPRLHAMDADVHYEAARVVHVSQLPPERISVHVAMKDGRLQLDPLAIGIAGGEMKGRLRIDGSSNPAVAEVQLNARALELNKLFPRVKFTRASFGKIEGDVDLKGRGNTVAQMLGTSSGKVAMLMGHGEVSKLLMELAELDGGGIISSLLKGDENVELRCAGVAFDVNHGLMTSRALVFDTADTVIYGDGQVSLANETMDLTLHPYAKDRSILALRSPLKVAGTFVKPKLGPEKSALAAHAGAVLALGAVNPLLGLAATVQNGPGRDADCGPALREAASSYQAARIAALPEAAQKEGKSMGAAASPGAKPDQAPARPQQDRRAAPAVSPANRGPQPPHAPGALDKPYGS